MISCDVNKILLVSLCDGFSVEVGDMLAQTLGMMFCDVADLVSYELIDQEKLKEISSKEYLLAVERKVMRHFASFENVVGAVGFDYYVHNTKILSQKTVTIFLNLPKSFVKEKSDYASFVAFDERTKRLQEQTNLTVNIKKTEKNFVCEKILDLLRGQL